jgi:hypothetical protein
VIFSFRIICIKILLLLFSWISIQAQTGFYYSLKKGYGFTPNLEVKKNLNLESHVMSNFQNIKDAMPLQIEKHQSPKTMVE